MEVKTETLKALEQIEMKAGVGHIEPRCEIVQEGNQDVLYLSGAVYPDSWAFEDEPHISAKAVRTALDGKKDVVIHINSPGGSVFEGLDIYNVLKDHKGYVTVQIDGIAASIASVICMGADKVTARKPSVFMIHRAWAGAVGNPAELRKFADQLEEIDLASNMSYIDRFNGQEYELNQLLDAETYLSAEKAQKLGFIDEIIVDEKEKDPVQEPEEEPAEEPKKTLFDNFVASAKGVNFYANFRRK